MSLTCITRGKARVGYGVLIVKPQGKRPFGKSGGEKLQKIKNTTFWGKAPCSHLQEQTAFQPRRPQTFFFIPGLVHRTSILIRPNKMQHYAGIYLLQNYSICFGCPSHPSSRVHKTVTADSGTGHSIGTTFLQRGLHTGGGLLL